MLELRCDSKKHGVLIEPGFGILEVKCDSRFCGARTGAIVLHRFDLTTGEMVDTHRYNTQVRRQSHGSD
jgi:hypothetical protein